MKFSIERIPVVSGPNPTTIYVRRVKEVKIIDPLTVHIVTDGPAPNLPNDFIRLFIVSAQGRRRPDQGHRQRGLQLRQGRDRHRPLQVRVLDAEGPARARALRRLLGRARSPGRASSARRCPNDAARVAQLKAGQVDIIVRAPASDVADAEARRRSSRVATIDTVYVFNMELDMREKSPQVTAKDGSPLAKNPLQDPKVREAIDLAIDRPALAEIAMEGLGKPVNQLVTANIFGFNKALPALKPDLAKAKKLMAEAGYPNGFKVTFSFTNDRLPGDRAGRHLDRADAGRASAST